MNIRLTKKMKAEGIKKVTIDRKNDDNNTIVISIIEINNRDYEFNIMQFPYCCGTDILFGIQNNISYNNKLSEKITDLTRKVIKKYTGAPNVMCTLSDDDVIELMVKCGWEIKGSFYNENSENEVSILMLKV